MTDFKSLNSQLQPYWESILLTNAPGGKVIGKEYVASAVHGGSGRSFSFNLVTGLWKDFSTGDKGGDIISYYAFVKSISQGNAAKELTTSYIDSKPMHSYPVVAPKVKPKAIKPPPNAQDPGDILKDGVKPSRKWVYRDHDSKPLFYIYRYDYPDRDKDFRPYCYTDSGKWTAQAWPSPRPLYNLDKIIANPTKPILLVEGEKTADAITQMTNAYIATTWPGGAESVKQFDTDPLKGRKLLLWPDADTPGLKAMDFLASKLLNEAEEIKIIKPDRNSGWDAADAVADGWTYQDFKAWASKDGICEKLSKPLEAKKVEAELVDDDKVSSAPEVMAEQLGLSTKEIGKQIYIIPNASNVKIILKDHTDFKDKFWYDSFYSKCYTNMFGKTEHITDFIYLDILTLLQQKFGLETIAKSTVIDAIDSACYSRIKSEPQEWLNSLVWDNVPRIEEFFIRAMKSKDNDYTRSVGKNFFIAQAARVMNPGCKFDNMIVLDGPQGIYKSTSLDILGGKWFTEAPSNLDNKDFEQSLIGRMIVEFGELDQFRKAEDTLIKKKLSCRVDSYRPSYGRTTMDFPRTCIFVATTNDDKYLSDPTGSRRFWPIHVEFCDTEYIKEFRDQFYAEAVHLFKAGVDFHNVPESISEEHELRRKIHPWEEIIADYLKDQSHSTAHLTTSEIWENALNGDKSRLDQRASIQIAKAMRALGWVSKMVRLDDQTKRFWVSNSFTGVDVQLQIDRQMPPKVIPNYAPNKM